LFFSGNIKAKSDYAQAAKAMRLRAIGGLLVGAVLLGCRGGKLKQILLRRATTTTAAAATAPGSVLGGHAYFVATPLGNLQDVTLRALSVLSSVDIVAAEDTRNTAKLFRLLNIKGKKIVSHHEHNWKESTPELVRLLNSGSSVALVSDAGSPGISDPGAQLAAACAAAGIPTHPVPGPSAVVAALSIAGFSESRFTFFGFVPAKGKDRKQLAEELMRCSHVAVFFDAPHRIPQTMELLQSLVPQHGDKQVVACRELTKLHETVFRGTLAQTAAWLASGAGASSGNDGGEERVRGEFTVLIAPPLVGASATAVQGEAQQVAEVRARLLELQSDGVSRSEAVRLVSAMGSVSRSSVYRAALDLEGWN